MGTQNSQPEASSLDRYAISVTEDGTKSMEVMEQYPHCELIESTEEGVRYSLRAPNVGDAVDQLISEQRVERVEIEW